MRDKPQELQSGQSLGSILRRSGLTPFLLGVAVGVILSQRERISRLDRERMVTRLREARGDRMKSPPRIVDERVGAAITESAAELQTTTR